MVFTKNGKTYPWELTVGVALRVKDALDLDLLSPEQGSPPLAMRLESDDLFFSKVYAEILSQQIEGQGETKEQFLSELDGKLLVSARNDFAEKYTAFFQSAARTDRVTLLTVAKAAYKTAMSQVEKEYVKSAGTASGNSLEESV